jgi:cell volume regulation protein A
MRCGGSPTAGTIAARRGNRPPPEAARHPDPGTDRIRPADGKPLSETYSFAVDVLLVSAAGLLALLSNRLTERTRIPAPLIVLVAAAVVVKAVPDLHAPPERIVEQLVTVALVLILFDGGMHIGWSRFRAAAKPIAVVGVAGTFLTAAGAAVFLHAAVGLDWYVALLVATAVSPTDPAVVFSVLGQREISGRSGTILEGESGANDPVGIALMAGLIAAHGVGVGPFGRVAGEFGLQMVVGGAVGLIGGRALLWFMRAVPLPSESLYPLRTAVSAFLVFAAATLLHGSGFLAVFVAGILLGDARAPYKREIERFQSALASLGEVVAFGVLGLTIDLGTLARADVWVPGLLLGLLLAVVIRPVLVGICLAPWGLSRGENAFMLLAGLKGAVPILLGGSILDAALPDAQRLYGIVVVVVIFSVAVQGTLVPTLARVLHVPMRAVQPEPWALGLRLRSEPDGAQQITVAAGAPADGRRIDELHELPEDSWISLIVRDDRPLPVRDDTRLRAGDRVLVLATPDAQDRVLAIFGRAATAGG